MNADADTIFALSSGAPPAAIAVIRLSGEHAVHALSVLAGRLPAERRIALRTLRRENGEPLDRALVHWARGPATATGEDIAEFHVHGGRAVVDAVLRVLEALPEMRHAAPGEFTRRAFLSGRIDLSEAEGLADLLAAETETQRRAAFAQAGGAFGRRVETWRARLLGLAAVVEARIEFDDDDGIAAIAPPIDDIRRLATEIRSTLASPPAERLRDGIRVVIAGPPNMGKSTLLNALAGRDAAIVSSTAGTTRDVIEVPIAIDGIPFLLTDTAGLQDATDPAEAEGVERARVRIETADILLWTGCPRTPPTHRNIVRLRTLADIVEPEPSADLHISAKTGAGLSTLRAMLIERAADLLPRADELSLNARQRQAMAGAQVELDHGSRETDDLIVAERLRAALAAFDEAVGRSGTEQMLDALFGQFCVGK